MATRKRVSAQPVRRPPAAQGRSSSLAQQLTLKIGVAPPSSDKLLEARKALDADAKLSRTMANFIAIALNYLQVMLLEDAMRLRRGRRAKPGTFLQVCEIKNYVEDGTSLKVAVVNVIGKNATMSDFDNLKRAYHKHCELLKLTPRKDRDLLLKLNPRKAK